MAQELPEGTVTVLFTDVEGSTALTTRRGDEAAQEILRAQRELVRREVEEHSGHEVKSMGDGFMVAFSSARRAVACAVAIQRALEEHNRQDPGMALLVRMGLNTGEAIREEADLFGAAVTAADRIACKAKGGQILVSEAVRAVTGSAKDAEFVDRGRFRLKGFPDRWRLYEVVWQQETRAAQATPVSADRTPFVGREAERADLSRFLDQTVGGQGTLVMIGGEPGVGKTRLAEELAVEARERGVLTLVGHCYEMEGAPPYVPFVEILESAARAVPADVLGAALGDSAPEVAKLMPELRRIFPDIPPPLELPADQERHYLFNSVREFVARASNAQPIVLVLDDLHWADDSTLLLLQHVAQHLNQLRVLVVGTYRDVELDVARPLAKTLGDLLRQRLAHRIALKRLPEAGVEAMLRAVSGQEPPAGLVQAIYSETEGNPFFVEEVYQHLAEEGKLFDAKGRWRSDLHVSELDVPEGVRLVIGRRLQRVSEDCRRVLTSAAVIGRAFNFELLEALADVDADDLLDAVDEAERAQLIVASSDGREARFTFAHELIRQTLLSGLSLPRRQRLHLRVAEAMERAYSRSLEQRAVDLAYHLYEAGAAADPQKTAHYLRLAGDGAYDSAAFEDALRHYETALSLQPADDTLARATLLDKRGLAKRSLGRWDEALSDWQEALTTFEERGDAKAVGRVCSAVGEQLLWSGRFGEALEISRRGLIRLEERVSAERCRLLATGGLALSMAGNYAAGDDMIAEALALAEQLGDQGLLGMVLYTKTVHHHSYMQPREEVEAGLRAADLLRSAGDLWGLAGLLGFLAGGLFCLGRLDEIPDIAQERESLATRVGHLAALLDTGRVRGMVELILRANLDPGEELAREDLRRAQSAGRAGMFRDAGSYAWLGVILFWKGRWQEALEILSEGANLEPPVVWDGAASGFFFLGKAYVGDSDAALPRLREKMGDLLRPGQPNTWDAWTMLLAVIEGLGVMGERDEAASLYPLVLEAIDTGALIRAFDCGLLQCVAGIAAGAGGQWEKAEEHYHIALRQAHDAPFLIQQPEVRRWYARMLIYRDGHGDREKARQLLDEAIAMYRQIGMPRHVEMAAAMLAEL